MLDTNNVVSAHSSSKMDFIIEENNLKKINIVRLKCQPFIVYNGKIHIKGQISPLRFEFDEDEILNYTLQLSFDDPTFSGFIHTFKNQ